MRTSIVVLLLLLLPVLGAAQSLNDFSLRLSGGISVPFSTNNLGNGMISVMDASLAIPALKYADVWSPGLSLSGGLMYDLDADLSLLLDVGYNAAPADKELVRNAFGLTNGEYVGDSEVRIVTVSAGVKYALLDPRETISPYVIAQVGYANVASDSIYILASAYRNIVCRFESQSSYSGALGVGVDFSAGKNSSIFVEIMGSAAYTNQKSLITFIPVRVGIKGGL